MIYKKNSKMMLLIYYYIWFSVLCISNVWSEITSHSNNNTIHKDYDVTTIYRMMNAFTRPIKSVGFKDPDFYKIYSKNSYSIEIHSRTNAIGLPITAEVNSSQKKWSSQSISLINKSVFFKSGLSQNNSRIKVDYVLKSWQIKSIPLIGVNGPATYDCNYGHNSHEDKYQCVNASEYRYEIDTIPVHKSNDYNTIFSVIWTSDHGRAGLSITYIHTPPSKMDIFLNIAYANNGTLISFTKLLKFEDVKTITFNDIGFMKNQEYIFTLKMKMNSDYYSRGRYNYVYSGFWFGLIRIAESSNYDEEDVRVVYDFEDETKPFNVLGNYKTYNASESMKQKSECLNGGYSVPPMNNCTCPPGFIGELCETACGPNSYGFDCKGVCSMHSAEMCRGMYMCTKFGCTCPTGFTGPLCNRECETGKFGADCNQYCSSNCYDRKCDRYTGLCSHGCSPQYVLPHCLQKYPYLINPPKLLSTEYESIEIECDFQSSNVMGEDKNIKLKYYQIVYKALKEDQFINSDIKPIIENSNETKETLSGLEPDTIYLVGVLLITDDGNFNDQDIVYGNFKTSCIPPNIEDFNVTLVRGIKSINVSWNKTTTSINRFECNIIEYLLVLSYNQSQNQVSGVQKIRSNSVNGHYIYDLIPGYQYNIQLILNTTQGQLFPSPIYSAAPLPGIEFKIKDISTINENRKIKVSWKLGYMYERYNAAVKSVINEPVTCTIRYKINRILSCTLQELENSWMSVIISNQTSYEILDVVPNSQYLIQIITGDDSQMIYTLTPTSKPTVAPTIDPENPLYITNSSVFVQWKFDFINCSKLNGFFSKYFVELKEKSNNNLQVKETKQNNISFEDLKSNTAYELKAFIKNHIGYSLEHFLSINFTTRFGILGQVDDLMVYKKAMKNKVVGLRWNYPDDSSLDGFIISYDDISFIGHEKNVTIVPPRKCSAWPEYFCHTFYDLSSSKNVTFKVQAKSIDYPGGGLSASINFTNIDGIPDPPSNVKIIDIGKTYFTLQWDIPWVFNSVLKMFVINIEEISKVDMSQCCVNIMPTEIAFDEELPSYNYTLTGLQPGSTYSVGVLSVSKSLWYSSPAKVHDVTTLLDA
ncbi:unnamed protein product [Macrosiphum euphorbiae]|uniref:Uncharacterized protein n=2 Tax=Macrosiphum euphorbiae TaxID=13131 RepID=A0AAV0WLC3_9HEMI|nr:unnamed protein product [Macrosiphum euphorbiae]